MYTVGILSHEHKKDLFNCGVESLDRYIKNFASKDIRRNISVTYVATTENDSKKIVGYYTLSQSIIQLNEFNNELKKKLPKYPNIPATLLGRLAIDDEYQNKGIGRLLLYNALKRSYIISKQIASNAVIVDAIGDEAVSFYEYHGFLKTISNSYKLYRPINSIKEELFD